MSTENFKLKRNKEVRTCLLKVAYNEVKQYNINSTLMINSSSVDEICSSFKKDLNILVKNEPKKITNPSFLKNSDISINNLNENQEELLDKLLDKYFEYILQIKKILLSDKKVNKKKSSILNKKASLILKSKSKGSSSILIYQSPKSKNKPLLEKKHEFLSLKMDIKILLHYCNINQLSLLQKSNHINLENNKRLSFKNDSLMYRKNNLIFQNINKSAIRRYNSLGNNPEKHFQKKKTNTMYKLRSNNLKDVIIEKKENQNDINELNMNKILNLYNRINRMSECTNQNNINDTINLSNFDEGGLTNDFVKPKISNTSNFKLIKLIPSANDTKKNQNNINETINLSNFDEGGLTNDFVKPKKSNSSNFKLIKFVPSANDTKTAIKDEDGLKNDFVKPKKSKTCNFKSIKLKPSANDTIYYFNRSSLDSPNGSFNIQDDPNLSKIPERRTSIPFNIKDDPNLSKIPELKTNKLVLFRRESLNEFMREIDPILLGYFNNAMIFKVNDDGGEKGENKNTLSKLSDVESLKSEENNEEDKISVIT